jgi:hypothetical protein
VLSEDPGIHSIDPIVIHSLFVIVTQSRPVLLRAHHGFRIVSWTMGPEVSVSVSPDGGLNQ